MKFSQHRCVCCVNSDTSAAMYELMMLVWRKIGYEKLRKFVNNKFTTVIYYCTCEKCITFYDLIIFLYHIYS